MKRYDYIIVGAGSAGCVLANRLSADKDVNVLVLESGPRHAGLYSVIPAGYYWACKNPKLNWNYQSEPEALLESRRLNVPRGRVVGGSSAINAMVYLRGQPQDYDAWNKAGATGWSYADCLPYFKRSESSDTGANFYRGGNGPLSVERGQLDSPIFDAFLWAAEEAGHRISQDLNGKDVEGMGRLQATKKNGRRCSAATAYLTPALHRPNLELRSDTHVRRLLIEGLACKGVVIGQSGREEVLRAEREVILSGGAINSPQLLMLSGVGPADHLRQKDIAPVLDLPGVGGNLQDHMDLLMTFGTRQPISIAWLKSPLRQAWAGLEWLATRGGVAASNIFEVGGFMRSNGVVDRSNLQVQLAPVLVAHTPDGFSLAHGYSVHLSQLRQESRGRIQLRSNNPQEAPAINFNFLSTEADKADFREGVERIREIAAQRPLRDITTGEVGPGPVIKGQAEIDAFVAARATTEFHPSCTCSMGDGEMSVLNADLTVRGIANLRVVDASVMPTVVSANLNGPTIMIAEKASDLIRGRKPLPVAILSEA